MPLLFILVWAIALAVIVYVNIRNQREEGAREEALETSKALKALRREVLRRREKRVKSSETARR